MRSRYGRNGDAVGLRKHAHSRKAMLTSRSWQKYTFLSCCGLVGAEGAAKMMELKMDGGVARLVDADNDGCAATETEMVLDMTVCVLDRWRETRGAVKER